ncbi:MAG: ABC transporter substrate-binding protein [Candidatus Promineifilaceae bacterium]|nr:ABC transporter substrate-binding protein [Candidatus Promineifilaceae bacterium]
MKQNISNSIFLFLGTMFLVACGVTDIIGPEQQPEEFLPLRLPMGYIPDPQYAPLYVAVDKGYFAEEGFEIEFDYSFETDGMALVGANEVPFAIVGGDQVILARAQDLPVVYVFEWYQRYPIAVVSKVNAGIEEPRDLLGRTVGLPGFFGASYVGFAGLLSANNLALTDVDAIDVGFNQVETLLTDQAEAVVAFANNEPLQLANMGEEVNVIQVADYIDLVFNGIITNEETIVQNPELVESFLRAILRGLADTLADPDQAYEISKKYVEGLDDSRRDVLDASLGLWEAEKLGYTEEKSWQQTESILIEMGLLDQPVDNLEAAYTNQFVETAQP